MKFKGSGFKGSEFKSSVFWLLHFCQSVRKQISLKGLSNTRNYQFPPSPTGFHLNRFEKFAEIFASKVQNFIYYVLLNVKNIKAKKSCDTFSLKWNLRVADLRVADLKVAYFDYYISRILTFCSYNFPKCVYSLCAYRLYNTYLVVLDKAESGKGKPAGSTVCKQKTSILKM